MATYHFDFYHIGTIKDFYTEFISQVKPEVDFGNNLDALYDVLTGFLKLPANIYFINMSLPQLEVFEEVIATLQEAAAHLEENLQFTYSIRPHG